MILSRLLILHPLDYGADFRLVIDQLLTEGLEKRLVAIIDMDLEFFEILHILYVTSFVGDVCLLHVVSQHIIRLDNVLELTLLGICLLGLNLSLQKVVD